MTINNLTEHEKVNRELSSFSTQIGAHRMFFWEWRLNWKKNSLSEKHEAAL